MMNKRWIRIRRLLLITMVLFLAGTLYSGALGEDSPKEEAPYLVMEKVTDFFSRDNLKILEDARDRIDELTDSIGRGTERIGESIEKVTDFIGFGSSDSEEEQEEQAVEEEKTVEEEPGQQSNTAGKIVGTVKSKDGEALENIRVNVGNYATYTNDRGEFAFNNLPYGVYTLHYQESQGDEFNNIEEITIDSNNNRYVVSLVLDMGRAGEVLAEEESEREVIVDSTPEVIPENTGIENENEDHGILLFIIIMMLALLMIILFFFFFFVIDKKHIKTIDGSTGETLGKKKVDIKPVTWIDLTEEFQEASGEKIRVRFIRSAIKKLCGKKVIFTVDDTIIAEIQEYTGGLDFLVQRTAVKEMVEDSEERQHER